MSWQYCLSLLPRALERRKDLGFFIGKGYYLHHILVPFLCKLQWRHISRVRAAMWTCPKWTRSYCVLFRLSHPCRCVLLSPSTTSFTVVWIWPHWWPHQGRQSFVQHRHFFHFAMHSRDYLTVLYDHYNEMNSIQASTKLNVLPYYRVHQYICIDISGFSK